MINVDIKITKNSIELNFHGCQRNFTDFDSLWDFCLLTAANKGIFKVKMIHGRGRDPDGLAFIDESMRNRLENLRGVRWYRPVEGKLGVTLVYLSNNLIDRSKKKSSHQQLMHLAKELKKEEIVHTKKSAKRVPVSMKLETTLRSLDMNWDEALVLETAHELLRSGSIESLLHLLSEIKIFEIFYTDNFRVNLNKIIDELDGI